nr:MAG TPA: conjugal transfer protein [Caudoviricetes sp.]
MSNISCSFTFIIFSPLIYYSINTTKNKVFKNNYYSVDNIIIIV